MLIDNINYEPVSTWSSCHKPWFGKQFHWVQDFAVRSPKVFDGERFAHANLQITALPTGDVLNGMWQIQWFTCRDETGDILPDRGKLTWTFSDILKFPIDFFESGNFRERVVNIVHDAFMARLDRRREMQECIDQQTEALEKQLVKETDK